MTSNEKEILLEEVNETKNESEEQEDTKEFNKNSDKDTPIKQVDRKNVNQLTEEERNIILSNARAGIDQPHFNVTFYKNGNYRIVKRKAQQPTVSQKAISKPTYYTDNQLLYEHIIELTSKIERLTQKHKKLKHRYNDLQHDLYVDDNDNDNEPVNKTFNEEQEQEEQQPTPPIPQQTINHNRRVSWINQITIL